MHGSDRCYNLKDLFDAAREQLKGGIQCDRQRQSILVVADDADADCDLVVAERVCTFDVPSSAFIHPTVLTHQESVSDVVPTYQYEQWRH